MTRRTRRSRVRVFLGERVDAGMPARTTVVHAAERPSAARGSHLRPSRPRALSGNSEKLSSATDSTMTRITRALSGTGGSRFVVMGVRVMSMVLNFLVQIVMARVMGLAAFGTANTALALLNILVIPAALGYDTAAIRYVALAQADRQRLRMLTLRFGRAVALGCLVTVTLTAGGAVVEYFLGDTGLAIGLALLIVIIPGFAIVRVGEAWLRGAGSVIRAQMNSNLAIPALSAILIVAQLPFLGSGAKVGVLGALGARAVATLLSAILVGVFVLRKLGGRFRPQATAVPAEGSQMHSAAMVLCGVALLTMLVSQADIVAVSYLIGASAAGVYSAASRVALAMNVCIVAVAFILAPRVTQLFAARRTAQLQEEVSAAAFWSATLMGVACLILIPASALVLHAFGSAFGNGANALRVLMLGQLVNGLCGPVAIVLNMTGKQKLAIRALGAAAIVDLALLLLLVPLIGITGAACATACCTAIWNVAMVLYVRRDLGIWVLPRALVKVLP